MVPPSLSAVVWAIGPVANRAMSPLPGHRLRAAAGGHRGEGPGSPAHAARGTASSRLRRLASLSTTPAARDPHQCRRGRGLRSAHRVRDLQPGQHPRTRCRRVGGRPAGQVGDGAAGPGDRRLRAGPSARASADRPDPLPRQTVATGRAGFLGPPHRDRGRGRRRAPDSARRVGNTRISARQAVAKRPGGQRIRVAS